MKKKKKVDDKSQKVLSEADREEIIGIQKRFSNNNKGFFEFLEKYPNIHFEVCLNEYLGQSFLKFLEKKNASLYKRFISDPNIGDYYKVLDDPLYGKNPENHDTITNALGRSIRFYGKGGRLSKRAIKIYYKTFETYDSEKQVGKKLEWSDVFRWTTKRADENGDQLISDEEDRERQKDTFLKFRRRNNLNSLADFQNYLKKMNYPADSR
jgi:hypothetical protein